MKYLVYSTNRENTFQDEKLPNDSIIFLNLSKNEKNEIAYCIV